VGYTVLFGINTWNMNWREGKMEEKREVGCLTVGGRGGGGGAVHADGEICSRQRRSVMAVAVK
jgi:hypothetical protein